MSAVLPFASIRDLAAGLRDGSTSAESLIERCLAAIDRRDGDLNAFVTVLADQARALAHRADQEIATGHDRGPLHGIPVSIKDLMDVEGLPTTAASAAMRRGAPARSDALVVARLRAAGAIIIGKCNLHELALGTTGEESAFGPTRNPHAPQHIAGGSSSGSAVSVAAGMAVASVGTDTGGSIRIPAAACGVVGLKPTYGELSCDGVVPLAVTLDHVGPIGATVDDVTRLYQAMAGREPTGASPTPAEPAARLGLLRSYFLDVLDAEVRQALDAALDRLRLAGCQVDEVDLPHADAIAGAYRHTVLYEAFRAHRVTLHEHATAYSPNVRSRLEAGATVSDDDYRHAQRLRAVLREDVDAALIGRDALLLPTLPVPPPRLGSDTVELGGRVWNVRDLTLRLTQLFDLTGHPAISIPIGTTSNGLPIGAQLVGRCRHTEALLTMAARHEPMLRQ